jgi:hypothetical protein
MVSIRSLQDRRALIAVAVLAVLLVLAVAAGRPAAVAAGGVGKWTNLTGQIGTSITQPSVFVTQDGLLRVAWIRDSTTPGLQDLLTREVKATGAFTAPRVLQAGWNVLNDPSFAALPSTSLQLFFSGMRSLNQSEVYDGLTSEFSTDFGGNWQLNPAGVIDPPGSTAYGSPVSAVIVNDMLFTSWYGTNGVWVHRGWDKTVPAYDYQSGLGNYGYYSNFALDRGGDLWLVWASNATGKQGVWAARVDQTTGAMLGAPVKLPGSTTKFAGSQQFDMMTSRVPAAGRKSATGVYVAYPTGYPSTKTVRLWKLTAAKITSTAIATGAAEKTQTAVAPDPKGRVWVVWSQHASGRDRVYVRRSNASVSSWGPTRYYAVPNGFQSVMHLAAVARNGKLDVLAHVSGTKGDATWHIQFKPPV